MVRVAWNGVQSNLRSKTRELGLRNPRHIAGGSIFMRRKSDRSGLPYRAAIGIRQRLAGPRRCGVGDQLTLQSHHRAHRR